ncbi:unnamed protein product [Paramecium sonneborni]|uniref:Uncharacterized protein n=1 Tax=Paramecium sonneborni TaxID=65129 RepID=A0A8S1M257_9CILI|nr:unnamed protein product [Paramecium sonneborni]
MGSSCQKNFIDYSDNDEIKLENLKIGQENYPSKIHKGGRKVLHRSKTPFKHFENDYNYQESAIQSVDLILPQTKSCQLKSTHSSSEKKIIAKEKQNHLISIIKKQSSYINTQSSLLAFSTRYKGRILNLELDQIPNFKLIYEVNVEQNSIYLQLDIIFDSAII